MGGLRPDFLVALLTQIFSGGGIKSSLSVKTGCTTSGTFGVSGSASFSLSSVFMGPYPNVTSSSLGTANSIFWSDGFPIFSMSRLIFCAPIASP